MTARRSIALAAFLATSLASADITLTARFDQPARKVSPLLYGIFFEEINRAGDGGIYAEMVMNRSFEDASDLFGWSVAWSGAGTAKVEPTTPNHAALRIDLESGRATLENAGFVKSQLAPDLRQRLAAFGEVSTGMAVRAGKTYDLTVVGHGASTVSAQLVDPSGSPLGPVVPVRLAGKDRESKVRLAATKSSVVARLRLTIEGKGTTWLDMVSLFPTDTWKGRPNGMRADLMERIAAIKPAFVRFPGGCFVEGFNMANAFRWKKSIGPNHRRISHRNLWGYQSSNGLGYHEYLQMCEDLKAEPLFVINVGMAHENFIPMAEMDEFVQDALDSIEYANGPVTSKWGAMRAAAGHPKPFNLKYLEIGNENGGPLYNERYALFYDAVRKRYPNIQIIANDWGGLPTSRPYDLIDTHNYNTPSAFLRMSTMYDNWDRTRPYKVYFGEYAVTQQAGNGNLQAAIGEAALMTGFERNSDVVVMTSYAPLLSNEPWKAWNPNAIVFDQARTYGTPSYWVQTMFGQNRSDRVVPVEITQTATPRPLLGSVGLGSYATQVEFKDLVVRRGTTVLYQNSFRENADGMRLGLGDWKVVDGALRQSSNENFTAALVGDATWGDVTIEVKARKLSGREGFFVYFATKNPDQRNFWNIAGWDNTLHAIQGADTEGPRIPGKVETGRWYDLKVEVKGSEVRCSLDGQFIQSMVSQPSRPIYAVVGRDDRTKEIILKVVNADDAEQSVRVNLQGLPKSALAGKAWTLGGVGPLEENSFAKPTHIVPRESRVNVPGPSFTRVFPRHSVTVFRLK